MKKLLIVLSFIFFAGCSTTEKPVATLTDNELKNAYWDTQVEIRKNQGRYQRVFQSPKTSYTTTGYANTYGSTTEIHTRTTPDSGGLLTRAIRNRWLTGSHQVNDAQIRLIRIQQELSRRRITP